MSEAEFRDALDPRKIVENRRTAGSARPSEVEAMIGEDEASLLELTSKLEAREGQVEKALEALDADFRRYL